jgi:hypothetical protein
MLKRGRAGRREGVWASHWVGEPNGPPLKRTQRFVHGDHGVWTRRGEAIRFESEWLQNHRMTGTLGSVTLEMRHGFTHGDPPVPVRYARRSIPPARSTAAARVSKGWQPTTTSSPMKKVGIPVTPALDQLRRIPRAHLLGVLPIHPFSDSAANGRADRS